MPKIILEYLAFIVLVIDNKLPADDLHKLCKDLHLKLKMDNDWVIIGAELFQELKSASGLLPKTISKPIEVLVEDWFNMSYT